MEEPKGSTINTLNPEEIDWNELTIEELLEYRPILEQTLRDTRTRQAKIQESLSSLVSTLNTKKPNGIKQSVKKDIIKNLGKITIQSKKIEDENSKKIIDTKTKKKYYRAIVTDHALLRYLERIRKIDLEKIREEILTKENVAALELGATSIVSNNIQYIASEGKVLTLYNPEKKSSNA